MIESGSAYLSYVEFLIDPYKALDVLFDHVGDMNSVRDVEVLDNYLSKINVECLSIRMMIGILSATFSARKLLKERKRIYIQSRERIIKLEGTKRLKGLLGGLE